MRRLILASALLAAACSPALAADRAFPIGPFDRIATSGPWDVRVHTGAQPSVRAHGPNDELDRLRIEVHGNELQIGSKPGGWMNFWRAGNQHVTIDVTVPGLTAVSLAGPGDLSVDRVRTRGFAASLSGPGDLTIGAIETAHVDLNLSGPGSLAISGRAITANLNVRGPGDIRAAQLTVRDATVALRGPGDIALNATGRVQGTISGPGDLIVRGGAACAVTKSGPGDVHCS